MSEIAQERARELLDAYATAYNNLGEAMDAREWPEGSPMPIMGDWQRARLAEFNTARLALEKALPDFARAHLATLDALAAAQARADKLAADLLAEADEDVKGYQPAAPTTLTFLLSAQVKRDAADRIRAALAGGEE